MDRAQLLQHFETLAETPEAIPKLRNFVLSLAVRSQLLPQNAADEKHARWKEFAAKFAPPETENGDEPPFLAPKSWRWVRLNDVADYAAADKVDPAEIKDADWVLDLEEIEKDTSRFVRVARFAEKQPGSTKAKFLPGDVLYGKLRPYLNKVVVAPQVGFCTTEIVPIRSRGLIEPTYLCIYLRSPDFVGYANSKSYGMKMPRLGTDDAKSAWVAVPPPAEQRRIVPDENMDRAFLLVVLQSPFFQQHIKDTTRTLAQPTLNITHLEITPIPVPPLAEQQRIVAKVDELMRRCDALEARLTAAQTAGTRLLNATLRQILTGVH